MEDLSEYSDETAAEYNVPLEIGYDQDYDYEYIEQDDPLTEEVLNFEEDEELNYNEQEEIVDEEDHFARLAEEAENKQLLDEMSELFKVGEDNEDNNKSMNILNRDYRNMVVDTPSREYISFDNLALIFASGYLEARVGTKDANDPIWWVKEIVRDPREIKTLLMRTKKSSLEEIDLSNKNQRKFVFNLLMPVIVDCIKSIQNVNTPYKVPLALVKHDPNTGPSRLYRTSFAGLTLGATSEEAMLYEFRELTQDAVFAAANKFEVKLLSLLNLNNLLKKSVNVKNVNGTLSQDLRDDKENAKQFLSSSLDKYLDLFVQKAEFTAKLAGSGTAKLNYNRSIITSLKDREHIRMLNDSISKTLDDMMIYVKKCKNSVDILRNNMETIRLSLIKEKRNMSFFLLLKKLEVISKYSTDEEAEVHKVRQFIKNSIYNNLVVVGSNTGAIDIEVSNLLKRFDSASLERMVINNDTMLGEAQTILQMYGGGIQEIPMTIITKKGGVHTRRPARFADPANSYGVRRVGMPTVGIDLDERLKLKRHEFVISNTVRERLNKKVKFTKWVYEGKDDDDIKVDLYDVVFAHNTMHKISLNNGNEVAIKRGRKTILMSDLDYASTFKGNIELVDIGKRLKRSIMTPYSPGYRIMNVKQSISKLWDEPGVILSSNIDALSQGNLYKLRVHVHSLIRNSFDIENLYRKYDDLVNKFKNIKYEDKSVIKFTKGLLRTMENKNYINAILCSGIVEDNFDNMLRLDGVSFMVKYGYYADINSSYAFSNGFCTLLTDMCVGFTKQNLVARGMGNDTVETVLSQRVSRMIFLFSNYSGLLEHTNILYTILSSGDIIETLRKYLNVSLDDLSKDVCSLSSHCTGVNKFDYKCLAKYISDKIRISYGYGAGKNLGRHELYKKIHVLESKYNKELREIESSHNVLLDEEVSMLKSYDTKIIDLNSKLISLVPLSGVLRSMFNLVDTFGLESMRERISENILSVLLSLSVAIRVNTTRVNMDSKYIVHKQKELDILDKNDENKSLYNSIRASMDVVKGRIESERSQKDNNKRVISEILEILGIDNVGMTPGEMETFVKKIKNSPENMLLLAKHAPDLLKLSSTYSDKIVKINQELTKLEKKRSLLLNKASSADTSGKKITLLIDYIKKLLEITIPFDNVKGQVYNSIDNILSEGIDEIERLNMLSVLKKTYLHDYSKINKTLSDFKKYESAVVLFNKQQNSDKFSLEVDNMTVMVSQAEIDLMYVVDSYISKSSDKILNIFAKYHINSEDSKDSKDSKDDSSTQVDSLYKQFLEDIIRVFEQDNGESIGLLNKIVAYNPGDTLFTVMDRVVGICIKLRSTLVTRFAGELVVDVKKKMEEISTEIEKLVYYKLDFTPESPSAMTPISSKYFYKTSKIENVLNFKQSPGR